ncbi:MAG: peptidylprolyl isomerase [Bacteroidales bacterium]|nr:peptidylprolyl isomerase [Bacteroidales bacterium]
MIKTLYKNIIALFISAVFSFAVTAQDEVIDRIIGVVGDQIILQSDIENQYLQFKAEGYRGNEGKIKCSIFEDQLAQKLLLNQAKVDSVEITESQVEMELNRRLQAFINQIGSEQQLEDYYKKSILEIKEDFRDLIRDQLLTEEMQRTIAGEITVTPSEVRKFYKRTPKDSLPLINSQIEIRQIVKIPPFSEEAKLEVREKLLNLRKRIINGESFSTLAVLYSEDKGTAIKGGELGYTNKADLVIEFANTAFSLKKGVVSTIVETEFGYHLIKLIDRRNDQVNVRHILMKPKTSPVAKMQAKSFLDSLSLIIRTDSITFKNAARGYSDDPDSRLSGGILINPRTGDTKFEMDQLDKGMYNVVKDMKIGKISDPFEAIDEKGNLVYKIVSVISRSKPHTANLVSDYKILQELTKQSKQQEFFSNWINDKQKNTYIRIVDDYQTCTFSNKGWLDK